MRRSVLAFPRLPLAAAVLLAWAGSAPAGDWPQWLGPRRDGVWREEGILDKFPPGGPAVRWRTPLGGGYAGPAVAGGRVYVTDRVLPPRRPQSRRSLQEGRRCRTGTRPVPGRGHRQGAVDARLPVQI